MGYLDLFDETPTTPNPVSPVLPRGRVQIPVLVDHEVVMWPPVTSLLDNVDNLIIFSREIRVEVSGLRWFVLHYTWRQLGLEDYLKMFFLGSHVIIGYHRYLRT